MTRLRKVFILFSFLYILSSILFSSARGMGAGYRSSADSPTALGKGANKRMLNLPLFLMVARPDYLNFRFLSVDFRFIGIELFQSF
jgi:hypothetical protein